MGHVIVNIINVKKPVYNRYNRYSVIRFGMCFPVLSSGMDSKSNVLTFFLFKRQWRTKCVKIIC